MKKLKIKEQIEELELKISGLKELLNTPVDLFKSISNYSDVCEELGIKELTIENFNSKKAFAFHKIENIQKLFNGDWLPDFNNSNRRKHYPYFEYKNSRLVFLASYSYGYYYYSQVAFYKDQKTSDFVGQVFEDVYGDLV